MQTKVVSPAADDAPEGDAPAEDNAAIEDNAFAPVPYRETEQRLHASDNVPNADDAKIVTRSDTFLSRCALKFSISMTYMRSHLNLLFVLSTIVALMAILIQLVLEPEMARKVPHSSSGSIRPGWARHRNEGWEYHTNR